MSEPVTPRDGDRIEKVNFGISVFRSDHALALGTDALLLAAYLRHHRGNGCELGCGSGIISLLALSRGKLSRITGIEIQPAAAELARRNAGLNSLDGRLDIINGDIAGIKSLVPAGSFSAVVANPPYLRTDSGFHSEGDAENAARREVYGDIGLFARAASYLLAGGGSFYLVYRPERIADAVSALRANRLEPKRMTFVYPTVIHRPSLVLIEAKSGAMPDIFITKPLIIYSDPADMSAGGYSPDMKYIYENGDFDDLYKKP